CPSISPPEDPDPVGSTIPGSNRRGDPSGSKVVHCSGPEVIRPPGASLGRLSRGTTIRSGSPAAPRRGLTMVPQELNHGRSRTDPTPSLVACSALNNRCPLPPDSGSPRLAPALN